MEIPPKITTIIFDMDGVLIDSEPVHKLAKDRAFARFGIGLTETVYERYKGRPDQAMMKEVVRSIPGTNLDPAKLLRMKHSEFEAIEQLAVPIEGAKNPANWATSRFQIALATSATPRNRQAAVVFGRSPFEERCRPRCRRLKGALWVSGTQSPMIKEK